MPRKKTTKIATETKEAPVVEAPQPEVVALEESEAKKAFKAYMESYKSKNPTKYASKEQAFNKYLETL